MKMQFTQTTSSLENLFQVIIETILNLFDDKKQFVSKLSLTKLVVTDTTHKTDSAIFFHKNGYFIKMKVNISEGVLQPCLQFAHELGHLICMPFSLNPFGNFNQTDESFSVTTLTRVTRGITYGASFEEAFCNYLACLVIEQLKLELSDKEKDFFEKMKKNTQIIHEIISCFEFSQHEMWDEKTDNNPCNPFLFGVATGDVAYAIYLFDKDMGQGEWMKLMQTLYWFYTASSDLEKKSISRYVNQKTSEFKMKFQNAKVA